MRLHQHIKLINWARSLLNSACVLMYLCYMRVFQSCCGAAFELISSPHSKSESIVRTIHWPAYIYHHNLLWPSMSSFCGAIIILSIWKSKPVSWKAMFLFFYDGMAGINMMVNFVIFIMVIKSMKIKVDNIVPNYNTSPWIRFLSWWQFVISLLRPIPEYSPPLSDKTRLRLFWIEMHHFISGNYITLRPPAPSDIEKLCK